MDDQEKFEEKFLGAGVFKKVYRGLGTISGAMAAISGILQFGEIGNISESNVFIITSFAVAIITSIFYLLGMGKIEYNAMKRYSNTTKIEDEFFEILSNYGKKQ